MLDFGSHSVRVQRRDSVRDQGPGAGSGFGSDSWSGLGSVWFGSDLLPRSPLPGG